MGKPVSFSLIVPVYEEEYNVAPNIEALAAKLQALTSLGVIKDYEILVFQSAERYLNFPQCLIANKNIKFIDHGGYTELGGIFRRGIKLAEKETVGLITPYNQVNLCSLDKILPALSDYDMVVAYIGNLKTRPWYRELFSALNTMLLNLAFGLKLKYYHLNFYRTALAKKVRITTDSHSAMVEVAVWVAKSWTKIHQVPFVMIPHNFASKSRIFRMKNIMSIFKTNFRLFWKIRILGKRINLN